MSWTTQANMDHSLVEEITEPIHWQNKIPKGMTGWLGSVVFSVDKLGRSYGICPIEDYNEHSAIVQVGLSLPVYYKRSTTGWVFL